MQSGNRLETRNPYIFDVPNEIIGDWSLGRFLYRFAGSGAYSTVTPQEYSIENDSILHIGGDSYNRVAGTTGISGTWHKDYPEGFWEEITFLATGFYSYQWNDGVTGSGSYIYTPDIVTREEQRATYDCSGDQITFTYPEGSQTGTFTIAGDTLTIVTPGRTDEYTRITP